VSRSHRLAALLALGACGFLGAACALRPIPITAQRGSTIVVPLGGADVATAFGGTEVSDPQRGEMVYYLQDSGGPVIELTTRASSLVASHPAAPWTRNAPMAIPYQMLSVVDIPQSAPYGAHPLYARRRLDGNWMGSAISMGPIEILPSTVTWTDGGVTYNVTGKSTYLPGYTPDVVPDPQIVVGLGTTAYAALVRIGPMSGVPGANPFPNKYQVVDVFESMFLANANHRPISKFTGGPYPFGEFVSASGAPFYEVAFVFRRVNASAAPLNLNDIYFEITAWDEHGVESHFEYLYPSETPNRARIQ
jgi:hypothetical protein